MKKNQSRTLSVFDIDGTLFNSDTHVYLLKEGVRVRQLHHGEFNGFRIEPGYSLDFSEFRSGTRFRESVIPIPEVFKVAKRVIQEQDKSSRTILLTARADLDDHQDFLGAFRDHGFPIDEVYVERAGNYSERFGSQRPPITKAAILKKYIQSNLYETINIWDDSVENLNTLAKLVKYHPQLRINSFLVEPKKGQIMFYKSVLSEEIEIPTGGLGISRANMPQIGKPHLPKFFKQLRASGVSVKPHRIAAADLKATQSDFSHEVVKSIMGNSERHKLPGALVSSDNYILDGHHRWLAEYNINKNAKMDVTRIDLPIAELMNRAKNFSGVEYRTLKDTANYVKSIAKNSIANRKTK